MTQQLITDVMKKLVGETPEWAQPRITSALGHWLVESARYPTFKSTRFIKVSITNLIDISREDLLSTGKCGRQSVNAFEKVLNSHGLKLKASGVIQAKKAA
jgi:hypothetical protein